MRLRRLTSSKWAGPWINTFFFARDNTLRSIDVQCVFANDHSVTGACSSRQTVEIAVLRSTMVA